MSGPDDNHSNNNNWFKTTTVTASSSSSMSPSSPITPRTTESGTEIHMSGGGMGGFHGDGPSFTDEENHHHHHRHQQQHYGDDDNNGMVHLPAHGQGVGGFCMRRKRHIIFGVVVVVVIGAIVGVVMALGSDKGDGSSNSNNIGDQQTTDSSSNLFVSVPGGAPTVSPAPTTQSDANTASGIIDSVARFGGDEFDNPQSYQSFAKRWVAGHQYPLQDGTTLTAEQQIVQLYAVACIYYNTFGVRSDWTDFHFGPDVEEIPGWFNSLGWMDDPSNVCNWYGLTCNENGQILKIELDTNGLTGYFPPEVALLKDSLQTIDLYNNIIHNSGELGNSFLGELTNLEYLYFGTTSFEYDGVPTYIGQLTKLQELDFSYTLYFGDLPGEVFANLSNLKYLVMDGNAYNTTLPTELIQLPSLQFLYAGFNFLQGDLEFVSQMPSIVELWMDDNPDLGGSIPASMVSASNLASLSVTNCGLTGTIPPELGNLSSMVQIWLYDNQLVGNIPSELGNLVTMKILNLQKNKLTGEMPSNICDRRRPFGRLEELEADCDGAVSCSDTCCTCCGVDCIDA
mmetsp:Transcript_25466/g.60241  ORF Transcript_25466/g.60241 Transcript_25466/m.60241 type:complete len:567 (-) Transcript_25466:251-1951(-)